MSKILPRVLGALLGLWLARAGAAELRLPPINGELEGVLTKFPLPGAPELHWRIVAQPASDGLSDYVMTLDAPATRLRATAHMAANGDGTWQIEESRVEAGPWLAVLAPPFAPSLTGLVAEGIVTITGGGNLKQGRPDGKIKVELANGVLRDAAQGWALEGIAFQGEFSFDADGPHWASVTPLQLTVRTISTARFGARNLSISATLDDRKILSLLSARIEVAGGEITVDPCTLPLVPPVVSVKLHLSRIGLQDIVALVPTSLSYARGRIDGEIQIDWSKAAGLQLGAGQLALRSDEPTIVRLTPSPGLLSASMPERFAFLPAWTGPLARWFSPLNPAYTDLQAIELGQTDLRAESLSVRLTPEGDSRGRSARVEMVARPEHPGTSVAKVTFDIDVAGPLSELLQLGTGEGTTLTFH